MQDIVQQICNLPLHFKSGNKSALSLAEESNFASFYKYISRSQIEKYLSNNRHLISEWQIWSEDKRTAEGYFLSIENNNYSISFMNSNGKQIFNEEFNSDIEACAEFILREFFSILNISE